MRLDGGHPALDLVNTIYGQVGGPVEHDVLATPEDLVILRPPHRPRRTRTPAGPPRSPPRAPCATPSTRSCAPASPATTAAGALAALQAAARAALAAAAWPRRRRPGLAVGRGDAHDAGAPPRARRRRAPRRRAELARLHQCAACCWLFLDHSRGAGRRWCSMADCGTEAKKAATSRAGASAASARAEPSAPGGLRRRAPRDALDGGAELVRDHPRAADLEAAPRALVAAVGLAARPRTRSAAVDGQAQPGPVPVGGEGGAARAGTLGRRGACSRAGRPGSCRAGRRVPAGRRLGEDLLRRGQAHASALQLAGDRLRARRGGRPRRRRHREARGHASRQRSCGSLAPVACGPRRGSPRTTPAGVAAAALGRVAHGGPGRLMP